VQVARGVVELSQTQERIVRPVRVGIFNHDSLEVAPNVLRIGAYYRPGVERLRIECVRRIGNVHHTLNHSPGGVAQALLREAHALRQASIGLPKKQLEAQRTQEEDDGRGAETTAHATSDIGIASP